ncbi:hypothetical protein A943_19665 [Bacillus sp. CPSM8]|nr:hypothetical protein A943_19665 [Bacillus sp. CPSM8]
MDQNFLLNTNIKLKKMCAGSSFFVLSLFNRIES